MAILTDRVQGSPLYDPFSGGRENHLNIVQSVSDGVCLDIELWCGTFTRMGVGPTCFFVQEIFDRVGYVQ